MHRNPDSQGLQLQGTKQRLYRAYEFFEVRIRSEEVLQAHVPILPAPEDPMAALWKAHIAAPGFLQLGILSCPCTHQHLQTLHTEAPVPEYPERTGSRLADICPAGPVSSPGHDHPCLMLSLLPPHALRYRVTNHFLNVGPSHSLQI